MSGYNPVPPATNNKGFWNANTNVPDYAVELTETGHYLIVSIAGIQIIDTVEINFSEGEYLVKIDGGFCQISPTDPKFTGFIDGDFIKVVGGAAVKADMRQLSDTILMGETTRTEQGSIEIGNACKLSEEGGFFRIQSAITDNDYLPVITQVTGGAIDPLPDDHAYRLSVGTYGDHIFEPDDTVTLSNVTSATYTTLGVLSVETHLFFDFANTVTNFRMRILRADTMAPLKYFPTEFAWIDGVGGIDIASTGKQEIYPLDNDNGTPMLYPPTQEYIIEMAADGPINLKGSATLPWLKVTRAEVSLIELADANGATPVIYHTSLDDIDGLDVTSLYPKGLLKIDSGGEVEVQSLTGGADNQQIIIMNLSLKKVKLKNETGTLINQLLRVEGNAEKVMDKYGGATLIYDATKGYWYVVGIII